MPQNICTFAIAHTDITSHAFSNSQRTVRIYIPNNINGTGIRVKFANHYAVSPVWVGNATIALCNEKNELIQSTIRPLKLNKSTSFALVPHQEAVSDFVRLNVKAGDTFAISLYYPQAEKVTSGNFVGMFAQRSVKGDYCNDIVFPKAKLWADLSRTVLPWDISSATTTVSQVWVQQPNSETKPKVIATFGDSIMQQGAWVTPFTARLYQRFDGNVSVCNLGIGGNRLLHDATPASKHLYGEAGIKRYKHDLLQIPGLTHVIFCLGSNDLGLPGKDGTPDSQMITLQEYQKAATQIVADLKKHNIKVIGGKILPREINNIYTIEREKLRIEINDWIYSSGIFDSVIDLGAPITDKSGVGMRKECSLPDGLHPNVAGGKEIANAIDLELFA